jgi:hypothetical protein
MAINTENWLYSLEIIKHSKILKETFENQSLTTFNYDLIRASFKAGYLKESIISDVENIGAICYEIDNKIFLHGETKGGYDFIGDKEYTEEVTELFDMTTEMTKGDSYSFYASTTSYFKIANIEDCVKVNEFLKTLK